MANVNQNQTQSNGGRVYYNKGYLYRGSNDPVGVSGKSDSLELYVYDVKTATTQTNETVLELSTSGHFSRNNGIDYVLGEDAYADKTNGLMYVRCTAWGAKKDRLLQLNIRKGFVLRIYGKFEKQTFTRQDGTQGSAVVCKNIQQFEIVVYPKDNNGGTSAPAPAQTAPAPQPMNPPVQPTPAPATAPAPQAPVQASYQTPPTTVGVGDAELPF